MKMNMKKILVLAFISKRYLLFMIILQFSKLNKKYLYNSNWIFAFRFQINL